jgi:hypothetical protein
MHLNDSSVHDPFRRKYPAIPAPDLLSDDPPLLDRGGALRALLFGAKVIFLTLLRASSVAI